MAFFLYGILCCFSFSSLKMSLDYLLICRFALILIFIHLCLMYSLFYAPHKIFVSLVFSNLNMMCVSVYLWMCLVFVLVGILWPSWICGFVYIGNLLTIVSSNFFSCSIFFSHSGISVTDVLEYLMFSCFPAIFGCFVLFSLPSFLSAFFYVCV
jgi:hypothetical protein